MRTFIFQLPLQYNDKTYIERDAIRAIELSIIELCGGLSRDENTEGVWLNGKGEIVAETQAVYRVAMFPKQVNAFIKILTQAKQTLQQDTLILTEIGTTTFI